MNDKITIGYLSWKRHDIFKQTLNSHKDNGLFELIPPTNRLIFYQEISQEDINIANEFECNYIGNNKNIGILNAFIELVQNCKTEYFIFCENDWYLIENKKFTEIILNDCIHMLNNNYSDVIRLRHRQNPGHPLCSRPSNIIKWLQNGVSNFPYKIESLSWLRFPDKIYNNLLEEFEGNSKWYTTTLDHQQWSNNIYISKTEYLKNVVISLLKCILILNENENENDMYGALEDILNSNYNNYYGKNDELDNIIIKYKNTRISGGEGLFTHKDKI